MSSVKAGKLLAKALDNSSKEEATTAFGMVFSYVERAGIRLCAIDAPEGDKGFLYRRQCYDFFDTKTELMEAVAHQANALAVQLDERKKEVIKLMYDAHDALRAEQRQ